MSGAIGKSQRAWLTPDEIGDDTEMCRRLLIPLSLVPAVTGALHELTLEYNWEAFGTMTPQRAAEIMRDMLSGYLVSDCLTDDAPYWDDPEAEDIDADEDAPIGGFPWYENLGDFIVGAFLAVAFSPDAAIEVITGARKLRLAFRSRDYGAIVRTLINGVSQGTTDTYSPMPGIVYKDIILPPEISSPVTLRIEHTGTHNDSAVPTAQGYAMEVIRKRLSDDDMGIQDLQVVGGQLQIKRATGGAWENVTDGDFVRRDGSLAHDITGTFVARPLTNTRAAQFQRALISATADILAAQTEAGADLWAVESDGSLALRGTGTVKLKAVNAGTYSIQVGALTPFTLNNNQLGIAGSFILSEGGELIRKKRIGATPYNSAESVNEWANSTAATRRARIIESVADWIGYHEFMRAEASGGAPMIGVLGASASLRQVVSGGDGGNLALRSFIDKMALFGWLTDSTTEEEAPVIPPDISADEACRVAAYVGHALWRAVDAYLTRYDTDLVESSDNLDPGFSDALNDFANALGEDTGFIRWTDFNEARAVFWLDNHADWNEVYDDPLAADFETFQTTMREAFETPYAEQQWRIAVKAALDGSTVWSASTIADVLANLYLYESVQQYVDFIAVPLTYTHPSVFTNLVSYGRSTLDDEWGCDDEVVASVEFGTATSNTPEGAVLQIPVVLTSNLYLQSSLTVTASVTGGTADDPDDYTLDNEIVFPAGSAPGTTLYFVMATVQDLTAESDETVILTLNTPTGATLGDQVTHTVTLVTEVENCGTNTLKYTFAHGEDSLWFSSFFDTYWSESYLDLGAGNPAPCVKADWAVQIGDHRCGCAVLVVHPSIGSGGQWTAVTSITMDWRADGGSNQGFTFRYRLYNDGALVDTDQETVTGNTLDQWNSYTFNPGYVGNVDQIQVVFAAGPGGSGNQQTCYIDNVCVNYGI